MRSRSGNSARLCSPGSLFSFPGLEVRAEAPSDQRIVFAEFRQDMNGIPASCEMVGANVGRIAGNAGERPAASGFANAPATLEGPLQTPGNKRAPSPARGIPRGRGRGERVSGAQRSAYLDTFKQDRNSKYQPKQHLRKWFKTQLRAALWLALSKCGRDWEAERLYACGSFFQKLDHVVDGQKCGGYLLQPCGCNHPLCPDCSEKRSRPLQTRIYAKTRNRERVYRFLTLTVLNVRKINRGYVDWLILCFSKLRQEPEWEKWISGGTYSIETTYNWDRGDWHVHIHVIIESERAHGTRRKMLPSGWIFTMRRAWYRITRGSHVLNLRAVNRKAVKELVKYQAKVADFVFSPELVDEYLTAFRNVRRVQSFGSFLGVKQETLAEVQAQEREHFQCKCGQHGKLLFDRTVALCETEVLPDGTRQLRLFDLPPPVEDWIPDRGVVVDDFRLLPQNQLQLVYD